MEKYDLVVIGSGAGLNVLNKNFILKLTGWKNT